MLDTELQQFHMKRHCWPPICLCCVNLMPPVSNCLCHTASPHDSQPFQAIARLYHILLQDVDSKMQLELDNTVTQCTSDIQAVIDPIAKLTVAEKHRLETALARLDEVKAVLENLEQKAANIE